MPRVRSLIGLALTLLLAVAVTANCPGRNYKTKLQPACDVNDQRIKWPNYENPRSYIACVANGNAAVVPCPVGQVFTYVRQMCTGCDSYIPAVECESLPTQRPPQCVAIDEEQPDPQPQPETINPTTNSPTTVEENGAAGTEAPIDPELTEDSGEDIPGPPSPSPSEPEVEGETLDPNPTTPLPTPPTPDPTPPFLPFRFAYAKFFKLFRR